MNYAIEATGLRKRFGATQALAGVDLAAREGTVLGVLGPNGAGKTTAVRILATLLRPDAGSARVAGHDVLRAPGEVRRHIGLTGQYASVDEDLTGTQNLQMIGELLNLTRRDARRRAAELLEWVRPRRGCRPTGQDLLRRHAAAAGPGRQPGRSAGGDLPGRADHRRPAGAATFATGRRRSAPAVRRR